MGAGLDGGADEPPGPVALGDPLKLKLLFFQEGVRRLITERRAPFLRPIKRILI